MFTIQQMQAFSQSCQGTIVKDFPSPYQQLK